jgi:hypothetical protein
MSLWQYFAEQDSAEKHSARKDSMDSGVAKPEVRVTESANREPRDSEQPQSITEAARLLREFRDAVEALKTPPQLNIQADKFVLVDASGRRRAELTMAVDGTPGLFLYDDNGVRRGAFNLSVTGAPSLVLYDKVGKPRGEVSLRPEGVVGLGFYDDRGEGRAEFFVAGDGAAALYLFGSHGERIAELPVKDGERKRE